MKKIKTKIHVEAGYSLPNYQSKDAAGCDLFYCGEHPKLILPLDRAFINTGVHIAIPEGYEAQVRGRSGLNKNHGIVVPTWTRLTGEREVLDLQGNEKDWTDRC